MPPRRGFFYLKKYDINERDLQNPTWCYSGRSFKHNETLNMPIELIDFCQTCQPVSEMAFKVLISDYGKMKMQNSLPIE